MADNFTSFTGSMTGVAKQRMDDIVDSHNRTANQSYDTYLANAYDSQVKQTQAYQQREQAYQQDLANQSAWQQQKAVAEQNKNNYESRQSSANDVKNKADALKQKYEQAHNDYEQYKNDTVWQSNNANQWAELQKSESNYQSAVRYADKVANNYEQKVNTLQSYIDNEQSNINAVQTNLDRIDYYQQNVMQTEQLVFKDKTEYVTFVNEAQKQGIVGSATLEKINGHYVFETARENVQKAETICDNHNFTSRVADFHKSVRSDAQKEQMYDYIAGTSTATSFGGALMIEALKEASEVNQATHYAQRVYDFLHNEQQFANPYETFHRDALGNITGTNREFAQSEFKAWATNNANNPMMKQANRLANRNAGNGMTGAEGFAITFVERYKKVIPLDKKGNIDLVALSQMTPNQLKKIGMSMEERRIAMLTFKELDKNVGLMTVLKRPMYQLGMKAVQVVEDEDLSEAVSNVNSARRISNNVATTIKKTGNIKISDIRKKYGDKKNITQKQLDKLRKKQPSKLKNKTQTKPLSKTRKNLANKTYKKINKRNYWSNQWEKSVLGKTNVAINKAREKLLQSALGKVFSAVMKFASTTLMYCLGIALGLVAMLFGLVVIVIALVVTIPSFFETTTEDTVVYALYEHLNDLEEDWVTSLEDTENLYDKREDLLYGQGLDTYEDYINDKEHLFLDGNDLYITPFDFEPADADEYCKEVTEYDGGSIITYAPNYSVGWDYTFAGGHTSNTKDIICMLDVMFQFDSENSDDESVSTLTDSTWSFVWNDFFSVIKTEVKLTGAVISSLWDNNALLDFQNSYKPDCTYMNLQAYCDTLFGASHQELINLDTLFFNVNTNTAYGNENVDSYDETYYQTQVLTECPDSATGGCCDADFLCFIENNTRVIGAEGTDGAMHSVSSGANGVVKLDGTGCLTQALISTSSGSSSDVSFVSNSACWHYQGESTVSLGWQATNSLPAGYVTIDRDIISGSPNSNIIVTEHTYTAEGDWRPHSHSHYGYNCNHNDLICGQSNHFDLSTLQWVGHNSSCYGCGKSTEYRYEYEIKEHIKSWYWQPSTTCAGHHGTYCGGHIACDVTGIVFSFTDDQIQSVVGNTTEPIQGKIESVNYNSFFEATHSQNENNPNQHYQLANAYTKGLNLYGTHTWDFTTPKLPSEDTYKEIIMTGSSDIFDIDHNIKYGYGFFPISSYTSYEGWTADNMEIALLKYTNSWGDEYGFDIPVNLGTPQLSESEINKIVSGVVTHYENMGVTLSETRVNALREALKTVGNGQYSQLHHEHGYFLEDCLIDKRNFGVYDGSHNLCSCTDCSGYASWHFINNGSTRLSSIGSTDTFLGLSNGVLWNGGNALPSDVLIKHGAGDSAGVGGNHALIFVGYVDEDIELSFGTIKAGEPITIDCTRIDYKGNIYLRNGGIDTISDCSYIMNRGADGNVWVVSFE